MRGCCGYGACGAHESLERRQLERVRGVPRREHADADRQSWDHDALAVVEAVYARARGVLGRDQRYRHDALERLAARGLPARRSPEVRLDRTRRERGDRHAIGRATPGGAPRERQHVGLGGRVARGVGHRLHAGGRGDVENAAAAALDHGGREARVRYSPPPRAPEPAPARGPDLTRRTGRRWRTRRC